MLRQLYRSALVLALPVTSVAGAQESNVTLSPFVTLLPDGNPRPMAGLALAATSGPFALRGSAQMSTQDRAVSAQPGAGAVTRPWTADADAVVRLEGLTWGERITLDPYLFTGVSAAVLDSGNTRFSRRGWSYGAGLSLPLASVMNAFGEWRWRMSRYVLPNAADAPSPTDEVRVGFSFTVGGASGAGVAAGAIERVISTAGEYVGTPYQRGGSSPASGFDASGFVRFVFARFGVILPRSSRNQAQVGARVDPNWRVISPGDLVMFEDDGSRHVAIYVGRNKIIHASETGGGVRYDDLSSERGRWFMEHLVAARRVTPDLRGLLLDLAREFAADDIDTDSPDRAPRPSRRR